MAMRIRLNRNFWLALMPLLLNCGGLTEVAQRNVVVFDVTGTFTVFHTKGGCWENGSYNMYCDIPNPINESFTGTLSLLESDSAYVSFNDTVFEGSGKTTGGELPWRASLVHGSWIDYPNEVLLLQGTAATDSIVGTVSYSSGYGGPSRQSKTGTFRAIRR
jgi:hypothetical protein